MTYQNKPIKTREITFEVKEVCVQTRTKRMTISMPMVFPTLTYIKGFIKEYRKDLVWKNEKPVFTDHFEIIKEVPHGAVSTPQPVSKHPNGHANGSHGATGEPYKGNGSDRGSTPTEPQQQSGEGGPSGYNPRRSCGLDE